MQERKANSSEPSAAVETQGMPVGTWQVKVIHQEGPLKGQTAECVVVFAPDHMFLILTPGPGTGTWQCAVPNAISFSFTELINYQAEGTCTGYVRVTQQGSLSEDGNSFTTSGQGVVYNTDGTHIATSKTTTQATRVSQRRW